LLQKGHTVAAPKNSKKTNAYGEGKSQDLWEKGEGLLLDTYAGKNLVANRGRRGIFTCSEILIGIARAIN
jgi:hypothetical protein